MTSLADRPSRTAYAVWFASRFAGRPVGALELGDDLLSTIFAALSREEEIRIPDRDRWGNWDVSHAHLHGRDKTDRPWLDAELVRRLGSPAMTSRWPGGKRFALCLTHDMDSVSHRHTPFAAVIESAKRLAGDGTAGDRAFAIARTSAKYAMQRARMPGGLDPLWHYEDWLEVESASGFRSTFFAFPTRLAKPHAWDANYRMQDRVVYDGVAMSAQDMLKEIAAAGWEVGLHGSYHSAVNAGMLADERRQIERAVNLDVRSIRQHYLHYDARLTPGVQSAAGLVADATQGFNFGAGFRAGTSLPHWCWDWMADGASAVMEVSQHIMDGGLFGPAALALSAPEALARVVRDMDEVERVGGCLTLNWHPEYLNLPAYWGVYRDALQEARHRNAWGCSVADVYDWWTSGDRALEPPAPAASSNDQHSLI